MITRRIPILLYHRILPGAAARPEADPAGDAAADRRARPGGLAVAVDRFRADMTRLHSHGWRCMSAREAGELTLAGRPAARSFVLTFDDGYRDFATLAHPILRDLGYTATVFIVTDRIGGRADWNGATRDPLLDGDEIRGLAGDGVEFGSHSRTHAHMPRCSDGELQSELRGSRALLSEIIGREVDIVAWPYGESDPRTRRAASEAGYEVGFGVAGAGPLFERARAAARPPARDRFAIPRREVHGGDSRLRRRLRMGPADGLYVAARKLGSGWRGGS